MAKPLMLMGYTVDDHLLDRLRERTIPLEWVLEALRAGVPTPKIYHGEFQTHYYLPVLSGPKEQRQGRMVLVATSERILKTAWMNLPRGAANDNVELS